MYAADITRTLPVNGHFTARQREIYDIVLGAQEAAMAAFQSGKSMLRAISESLAEQSRQRLHQDSRQRSAWPAPGSVFYSRPRPLHRTRTCTTAGDYKVPLGPGAAFTIEPGIYIPEENLGVRIEDDYYVDADGKLIKLSAALPSKAADVEKAMAGK